MSEQKRRLLKSPWFWFCVLLAGLIVHFWGEAIIAFVVLMLGKYVFIPLDRYFAAHPTPDMADVLDFISKTGWHPTKDPFLNFLIGILHVIGIVLFVVVTIVVGIAVVIVLFFILFFWWIIYGLYRLALVSRSASILESGFLIFIVAHFLYGVVFPIIYTILKPVLVFTFGEIFYQKYRSDVRGGKIRLRQPIYFTLGIAMLAMGLGRILVPWGKQVFSVEAAARYVESYEQEKKERQEIEERRLSFGGAYRGLIRFDQGEGYLYKWPSHDAERIGKIRKGTSKYAVRRYGDWYLLNYFGKTGWVYCGK